MSTGADVPTLHIQTSVAADGAEWLTITLSGCGEDASCLTIPLSRSGVIIAMLTRAGSQHRYEGALKVQRDGVTMLHETSERRVT